MKNIGMVVAVEIDAVLNKFGKPVDSLQFTGYSVSHYKLGKDNLYVVHSGAGQIASSAATQFLITKFDVDFIVNFGVVGGLTDEMALTKTCIVEDVVHYDFDTSDADKTSVGQYARYPSIYIPTSRSILEEALRISPELKPVICASGDKFVGTREKKRSLHKLFKADICEMEAAGIVLTCNRNKVPCMLIKTVSDGITGGFEEFMENIDHSASLCLEIAINVLEAM